MSSFKEEISKRRTFAIISHPDAGKTTLTEKLLLYGGAINLAGSVKGKRTAKHAVSDWMEIEKQRGISVTSSVLQFKYNGYCINILDTPGHEDFSEDTYRTLMAADSAVMVIDGSKGVEKQTIKLFKVCVMRNIPIITFINKMDRDAKNSFDLLEDIENVLGIHTYPVNWPIGSGKEFKGVYDRNSKITSQGIISVNNFGLIGIYILEPAEPVPPMSEDDIEFERFQAMSVFTIREILDAYSKNQKEKDMYQFINQLLKKYGFDRIKAADMIDHYNFEDRKLVEIVKATYFDPKIVVIDETTTALSQEGREELYKHMERIRKSGNTVIFISHDLPEILDKSDTITILRDGVYIDTVKSKDVTEDDLKKLMVGREVTGDYYRADYGEKVSDEVVLSVKNVTVPGLIENVSFDLHKGEILGFGGLSESGMHEIGKAIFGASYDRTGSVTLADGTQINDIPTAIKHSIAYTSKDRDNESVVLNQSIGDNICLPSLDELAGKSHLLSDKKRKEFADKYAKQMSVKMVDVNQFVSNLSGGNKQKVVLARWIGKDSDIVVLDSPTRGIDIKVKQDIYQLMNQMRKNGKSIIMISEELMELIGMCDRIMIMKDGKISGELERDQNLDENGLITMMV